MHATRCLTAAAALMISAGCALALDKVTVVMNWNVPYSGWAGFYVAKERGYYEKAGLDVEMLLVQGSNPANQALAAGSANLAVSNASSVVIAKTKGLPITAVSAYMQSNPEGVITRADAKIGTLADFVGKKIAVNPANPTVFMFEALLARAGVDKSKINFVNVQPEAMVPLILKGEVQGGLGYWDWQAINVEKAGVPTKVFLMNDDKARIYGNVVSANSAWLKDNGDKVRAFLSASVKGWIDAHTDIKVAHDVMMKKNPGEDAAFLSKALDVSIKLIGSDDVTANGFGHMKAENWQALEDALVQGGVIKQAVDPKTIFSNDYLPANAKDWGARR